MRKTVIILLSTTLMLASLLPLGGAHWAAYGAEYDGSEEYVKVGLAYQNSAKDVYTLESREGFVLGEAGSDGFEESLPLPAYSVLIATVEGNHVKLEDEDGVLITLDIGRSGCLMPLDYQDGGVFSLDGTKYRGGLMLKAIDGALTAINYLTMDEYLYGVLHREMSQSYPLESLKAQAVAARSYAAVNLGRHTDYGFDVCATTHCQVYGGVADEYPKTIQAVDETSGLYLRYNGKVVPAFYSKNSGGYTQNSEDVWSNKEGYLRAKKDEHSPDYPWTATIYYDDLQRKLEQAGYQPGAIQSVSVGARNSTGYVSELIITGSEKTVTLKNESIKSVLGSSLIRSRNFILAGESTGVSTGSQDSSGSGLTLQGQDGKASSGSSLFVLGGSGAVKERTSQDVYVSDGTQVKKSEANVSGGAGSAPVGGYTAVSPVKGAAVFSGLGYGHGVGMSQDGAIAMGQKGFTFEEILHYYFTDVEIR